ncbi:unnamed protein product [Moneuplotes crassus]|uniref:Uncharacterized protein n=1 Tax=Euplotes crassus TaxID=5936 RepID=A0AAD1XX57_EUPCR|nr:unnamed protein product [Moneuplotes crassus]
MNNIFAINQRSLRLTSCSDDSLPSFCCCLNGKSNHLAGQDVDCWRTQQWIYGVPNLSEINSFVQYLLRNYCACVRDYENSSMHEQASDSISKDPQQLVDQMPKRHEESKAEPSSEHGHSSRMEASPRHLPANNEPEATEEFTLGRVVESYKTRKDLVYKATFRRMRKHFIKDFREATKHSLSETNYPSKLREYCAAKFPASNIDRVLTAFDCVINSRGRFGSISHQDSELKSLIEKLMCFYSEKLFKIISSQPGFLEILLHFLSIEGVSSLIYSDQRVSFHRKVQTHLLQLKERAFQMLTFPCP